MYGARNAPIKQIPKLMGTSIKLSDQKSDHVVFINMPPRSPAFLLIALISSAFFSQYIVRLPNNNIQPKASKLLYSFIVVAFPKNNSNSSFILTIVRASPVVVLIKFFFYLYSYSSDLGFVAPVLFAYVIVSNSV